MPANLQDISMGIWGHVGEPAVRSLALACLAGILLLVFRVRNIALRHSAWKAVLCVALAMPLLGAALPVLPISFPAAIFSRILPAKAETVVTVSASRLPVLTSQASNQASGPENGFTRKPVADSGVYLSSLPQQRTAVAAPRKSERERISLPAMGLAIYLCAVLFLLARFFIGMLFSRRLVRASRPIDLGNSGVLRVAECDDVIVPMAVGVARPIILLPAEWREWSGEKLRAVLAHEGSHCARRDALFQRLSLLHRAIFWFSPLSWWLHAHLEELAEEASDEAALASGANRATYAETLVEFFQAVAVMPGRVWWQGMSMAKSENAERRVDRILSWKGNVSMTLRKSFVLAVAVVAVPIVFVAAAARPQQARPKPPAPPSPAAAPAAVPAALASPTAPPSGPAPVAPTSMAVQAPTVAPTPMAAPASPGVAAPAMPAPPARGASAAPMLASPATPEAMPAAPMAPAEIGIPSQDPEKAETKPATTIYVQSSDSDPMHPFKIHHGGCTASVVGKGFVAATEGPDMCTIVGLSDGPLPTLQAQISEDAIHFQREGKSYVIRDVDTVKRARSFFVSIFVMGELQTRLGKMQSALGEKQSLLADPDTLTTRLGKVRTDDADVAAQLSEMAAELQALSAKRPTDADLAELKGRLDKVRAMLDESSPDQADQTVLVTERLVRIAAEQGALAKKQGLLGKNQEEQSRKALEQLKTLLDDAFSRGLAVAE